MKELLELYNRISPEAQQELVNCCSDYFDPKQEDGKRKSRIATEGKDIDFYLDRSESSGTVEAMTGILFNVVQDYDERKKLINSNLFREYHNTRLSFNSKELEVLLLLNTKDFKERCYELLKYTCDRNYTDINDAINSYLRLICLFNTDFSKEKMDEIYKKSDPDNIRCALRSYKHLSFELFSKDVLKDVWLSDCSFIQLYDLRNYKEYLEIFDELMFCENGWTDNQKRDFIDNNGYDTNTFKNLVEYVLAVDMSYIKHFPEVFRYNKSLITELVNELKPESECNVERGDIRYRYPRKFRNLLMALYACIKETCGKVKSQKLKEIAPLLKLYNYDFNIICEAMYPEAFNEE